jgi:DNA polymerase-3 subunit epsilon
VYAIVDIETTGGFASANGITEIAIVLHDGKAVEGTYQTLIHPGRPIPRYITALTGINDEMVADAPKFEAVADKIYRLLKDRIFVAHNVNFDYSFVRAGLEDCGYLLNIRKLCTVRLARKIFPGLPSYSLGNLCRSLDIVLENRHRAGGDALATARLFDRLLESDQANVFAGMIRGKNADQYLPPHLPREQVDAIPGLPGVYYFENQQKEVVYVGKAINLAKRVKSHFSNNDGNKRKQDLLRQVHHIRFRLCSSELMALILESQEIRKIWPQFNRSQKKYHHKYGLYTYTDAKGYLQLVIDTRKLHLPAIYTFNALHEGQAYCRKLKENLGMNNINPETESSSLPAAVYNERLLQAIRLFQNNLPSFVLLENDQVLEEGRSAYVMDKGMFYGMGNIKEPGKLPETIEEWKQLINPCADNDYIRGLLIQYAEKNTFTRINFQVP